MPLIEKMNETSGFERLIIEGANPAIRITQSAVWFRDALYIGTGRRPIKYGGNQKNAGLAARLRERVGDDDGARDTDGAQLIAFDPEARKFEVRYESPIVLYKDGNQRARDRSIRAACVAQLPRDDGPTLYLGAGGLEFNSVILRSEDGINFEEGKKPGFGIDGDAPSIRSIVSWRDRLVSTPIGRNHGENGLYDDNESAFPIVFETDDPISGDWRAISEPGFGDPDNIGVNELVIFQDRVYAGTTNIRRGYQIWYTEGEGAPPYKWKCLLKDGAYRGPSNQFAICSKVFDDHLYMGSALPRLGPRGHQNYGPIAPELIRIAPDNSWELVVGMHRLTPDGYKAPVSGCGPGFDNPLAQAFWRSTVHDGELWVACSNWTWMPSFLRNRSDISQEHLAELQALVDADDPRYFSIYRTRDGIEWSPVTTRGFGLSTTAKAGVRELLSTPAGVFVSMAQPNNAGVAGGMELFWQRCGG